MDNIWASWRGSIPAPGSPELPASDPDAFEHPARSWHRHEIPTPNGKESLEAKALEIPSSAGSAIGRASSPTSLLSPTALAPHRAKRLRTCPLAAPHPAGLRSPFPSHLHAAPRLQSHPPTPPPPPPRALQTCPGEPPQPGSSPMGPAQVNPPGPHSAQVTPQYSLSSPHRPCAVGDTL